MLLNSKTTRLSKQTEVERKENKKSSERRLKVVIRVADYNSFLAAFGNVCTALIVFLAVPVITSASAVCSFTELKGENLKATADESLVGCNQ